MNTKTLAIASLFGCASVIGYAADAAAPAPAKEISTLSGIDVIGGALEKVSASIMADYESEFIFRGKWLADAVISPEVDVSYDIGSGFSVYVGWWGCYSTDNGGTGTYYEENDLYTGVKYAIDNFTIDFGYTVYTYPTGDWANENELKLVVSYDTSEYLGDFAVCPYVAGYYNFTYSGTTIESGLSYSAPVTKWLVGQTWGSLDLAAFGGYADYKGGLTYGGYAYAGFKASVGVAVTDFWSFSTGIRYAANNDGMGKDNNLWFGASTTIGF